MPLSVPSVPPLPPPALDAEAKTGAERLSGARSGEARALAGETAPAVHCPLT